MLKSRKDIVKVKEGEERKLKPRMEKLKVKGTKERKNKEVERKEGWFFAKS